ncbi:MAG TPA: tetratricopeptide repeat protein [Acetobacteraceae bacterium]|nr:tetratricopeptide repeat protein [Acetobacteraceae bacterium]
MADESLDALRQLAHAAYGRGDLTGALEIQQRIVGADGPLGAPMADDFLFLGLMLHGAGRPGDGTAILRDGLRQFPANAALLENLAVCLLATGDEAGSIDACQAALRRGSDSPNVHDCLADALNRVGRRDEAVHAGRAALEAKDRRFGGAPAGAAMPDEMPPPFNPLHPSENVIAYCLWGNAPRYTVPLLENQRILPHLFPGWTIRLYHDHTVDPNYLAQLTQAGAQLRPMSLPPGMPVHRKLLWRFDVIADPTVKRFLIRDADSLLSVKERVAVDAWLHSRFWFHAMRDWYTHTDLLLAGMWGGIGNVLPSLTTLLSRYVPWRVENDHVDQDVLSVTVWPLIRRHVLIHDSIFAPCLGSVSFPPFGHSAPGQHIGQNAFLHFTRSA